MKKTICNSETLMPKNPVKAKLIMAVIMGAALLPLSAMAAPDDKKPIVESHLENPSVSNKVNEVTNKSLDLTGKNGSNRSAPADNTGGSVNSTVDTLTAKGATEKLGAPTDELNDNSEAINAPEVTPTNNNVNSRGNDQDLEKPIVQEPKAAKKTPLWKNTYYQLGGGALLLILGGALLIFRKISALSADNRELSQRLGMLKSQFNTTASKLKQSNADNERLKAELNKKLAIRDEQNNTGNDAFNTALPPLDMPYEPPVIEDIDASDLKQLSDSITKWFTTNRGNTKVRDLVPADIQRKLDELNYSIELWVGSDGVDSVEPAQNTMRASVISLTKPDRQGFSYCYKKPNALSNVWVNKAWYQVQRTDRTLEVLGAPLEIN